MLADTLDRVRLPAEGSTLKLASEVGTNGSEPRTVLGMLGRCHGLPHIAKLVSLRGIKRQRMHAFKIIMHPARALHHVGGE